MKRRFLSILIAMALCLSLLPATALATGDTGVWVGDTQVEVDTYYLNDGNGGIMTDGASAEKYNVHYEGGVLTLKDAEITKNFKAWLDFGSTCEAAVYSSGSLEMELMGENKLTGVNCTVNKAYSAGIYIKKELTISGSGSVTTTGGEVAGGSDIQSYGAYGGEGVTISGGRITATGGAAADTNGYSYGVYGGSNGSGVTISGGSVTATGGTATSSYGVYGASSVTISGGIVTATGNTAALKKTLVLDRYPAYFATASTDISGAPTEEYNAENYGNYKYFRIVPSVIVGGTDVTAGGYWLNDDDTGGITEAGAGAENYHVAYIGGVLTLNGANITENYTWDLDEFTAAVYSAGSLEIELIGENKLTGEGSHSSIKTFGIYTKGDLSISGSGSLNAIGGEGGYGGSSCGVHGNSVTISGGTVTATGKGVSEGSSYGVYGASSVTISGGSVTATGGTASGNRSSSYGVYGGSVTISGGSVTATGGTATESYGVSSYGDDVAISGGIVEAKGNSAALKINADAKEVNIDGYPAPYTITASTDISGSSPNTYNRDSLTDFNANLSYYKYFHIGSGVYVGGTEVESGVYYINDGDGGIKKDDSADENNYNVYYKAGESGKDCVLTLKDANITKNHTWYDSDLRRTGAVYAADSLEINLIGTNTLTGKATTGTDTRSYGIYAKVNLTISGSGSLTATGGAAGEFSCGVNAVGFTLSGGNVTAEGSAAKYSSGVYVDSRITISGGNVTATGGAATSESYGVYSGYEVTISGGSVNSTGGEATATGGSSYGVYAIMVNISDGSVTATGGTATDNSNGVYGGGEVTISGGRVTATGGTATESCGVYVDGSVNISGGSVTATGGTSTSANKRSYGVHASFSISSGIVEAKSETAATFQAPSLSGYTAPYAITVSTDISGTPTTVPYNADNIADYRYFRIAPTCTVTLDKQSGSGGVNSVTAVYGSAMPAVKPPTRANYSFTGYFDAATSGTKYYNADGTSAKAWDKTADTTLYAGWSYNGGGSSGPSTLTYYTLTFKTNGGSVISNISKSSGTTVDLTTYKPTKTDFDFDGWYSDSELTSKVTSVKLTKNSTVYAKWTAKTVTPEMPFVDVPEDAYYKNAVLWAVGKGITEGTGDGTTFSPNDICTRAQMATFLWRAAGSPEPTATVNPLADVTTDAYYYKAVLWAVEQGITLGTGDGTKFSPNDTCSRGQMATFLYRYAGSPAVTGSNPFADVTASEYFCDAVIWAADKGVTEGTNEAGTTFSPDDNCTRGQIVTFLYRYLAK